MFHIALIFTVATRADYPPTERFARRDARRDAVERSPRSNLLESLPATLFGARALSVRVYPNFSNKNS
jgi:hypothetical protein